MKKKFLIILFVLPILLFAQGRGVSARFKYSIMPQIKFRSPRSSVVPLAFSSNLEFMISIMDWHEICLVNVQKKVELRSLCHYAHISEKEASAIFSQDNAFVKVTLKEKTFVFNTSTGAQEKSKNAIQWNKSAYLENKDKLDLDFHFYAPFSAGVFSGNLGFFYRYIFPTPSSCSPSSIVVGNQTSIVRYSMLGTILNVYLENCSEEIHEILQKENRLVVFFDTKVIIYDLESGRLLKQYELKNIYLCSIDKYDINIEKEYFFCTFSGTVHFFKYDLKTDEISYFDDLRNEIEVLSRCYGTNNCLTSGSLLIKDKFVFFTEENQILLYNVATSEIQIIPLDFDLYELRRKNNLDEDTLNYYFCTCDYSNQVLLGFCDEYDVTYLLLLLNYDDGKYTIIKRENGEVWGNITRIGYVSEKLLFIESEKQIYQYNLTEKKISRTYKYEQGWSYNLKTSNFVLINEKSMTISDFNGKILKEINDWNTFRKSEYYMPFTYISWRGFEEWNPLSCENGVPQEIVYGFHFLGAKESFSYTSEGFFTGTEWACKNLVYLVDGLEVTELNQLYDKLYRPDLIAAKARGEDISEYAKGINLASLVRTGKPPALSFRSLPKESSEREIKFELVIKDLGGGIGAVDVWRNGVSYNVCGSYPSSAGQTVIIPFEMELLPGETKIELSAYNGAKTIESTKTAATVKWTGTVKKPKLFLLTVAVNDYFIEKYRLKCCVPDAKLMEETVSKYGGIFENVITDSLLDSEVTKENLDKKFSEISSRIDTDDVFMLFFAGHGTEYGLDKNYYFLPYNCVLTNIDKIPEQCISTEFIHKNLSKIKAQKKMVILDTCQSGAFLNKVASRSGIDDMLILDRFKKTTGTAIFMAASSEKNAKEGYKGHGIFSYFVAEGLSGKADYDGDGYVRLKELDNYLCSEVPAKSAEVFFSAQAPVIDCAGTDFVLSKTE